MISSNEPISALLTFKTIVACIFQLMVYCLLFLSLRLVCHMDCVHSFVSIRVCPLAYVYIYIFCACLRCTHFYVCVCHVDCVYILCAFVHVRTHYLILHSLYFIPFIYYVKWFVHLCSYAYRSFR